MKDSCAPVAVSQPLSKAGGQAPSGSGRSRTAILCSSSVGKPAFTGALAVDRAVEALSSIDVLPSRPRYRCRLSRLFLITGITLGAQSSQACDRCDAQQLPANRQKISHSTAGVADPCKARGALRSDRASPIQASPTHPIRSSDLRCLVWHTTMRVGLPWQLRRRASDRRSLRIPCANSLRTRPLVTCLRPWL